jgi:hypothetical protein
MESKIRDKLSYFNGQLGGQYITYVPLTLMTGSNPDIPFYLSPTIDKQIKEMIPQMEAGFDYYLKEGETLKDLHKNWETRKKDLPQTHNDMTYVYEGNFHLFEIYSMKLNYLGSLQKYGIAEANKDIFNYKYEPDKKDYYLVEFDSSFCKSRYEVQFDLNCPFQLYEIEFKSLRSNAKKISKEDWDAYKLLRK